MEIMHLEGFSFPKTLVVFFHSNDFTADVDVVIEGYVQLEIPRMNHSLLDITCSQPMQQRLKYTSANTKNISTVDLVLL